MVNRIRKKKKFHKIGTAKTKKVKHVLDERVKVILIMIYITQQKTKYNRRGLIIHFKAY